LATSGKIWATYNALAGIQACHRTSKERRTHLRAQNKKIDKFVDIVMTDQASSHEGEEGNTLTGHANSNASKSALR